MENITNTEENSKQIAQLDRVGVLETTIAAMLQKAYQCFEDVKGVEVDEVDEEQSEAPQEEERPMQEEFETYAVEGKPLIGMSQTEILNLECDEIGELIL